MKKQALLTIALMVLMVSCGGGGGEEPTSNSTPSNNHVSTSNGGSENSNNPSIGTVENTVYLNLTEYGRFNGKAGDDIADMKLEYGYAYTALVGSALPGADVITNSLGNKFLGWIMPSTSGGSLRVVDVVPANENVILQAWFDENGNGGNTSSSSSSSSSSSGGDIDTPSGQYLAESKDSTTKYYLTKGFSTILNVDEWSVTATLEAGYEFMFFSTETIDATWGYTSDVYPTTKSNKADGIGYTLSADVQNGNYTDNYLEALNTDEHGDSVDDKGNKNGTYWKYTSSPLGKIRVKESGNYTIYINIWDKGGWLQIYATKNS